METKCNITAKLGLRNYSSRELKLTLAIMVVLALLGGILLQTAADLGVEHLGLKTTFIGSMLVIGYAAIVAILSAAFANRFVGPFKRLEYEMRLIRSGEHFRRLTVRSNDDAHMRAFIADANEFLDRIECAEKECERFGAVATEKLREISDALSSEQIDRARIKSALNELEDIARKAKGRC